MIVIKSQGKRAKEGERNTKELKRQCENNEPNDNKYISVSNLNVNRLNAQIKRHRMTAWI